MDFQHPSRAPWASQQTRSVSSRTRFTMTGETQVAMRLSSFVFGKVRDSRARLTFVGRRLPAVLAALGALAAVSANAQNVAQVDKALSQQKATDKDAAKVQQDINKLTDQKDTAADKYAQAMAEADSLEAFNKQLSDQVKSQESEIASVQKQLTEIETTSREVQPLMERMVDSLANFVSLDVPFLRDERMERVNRLRDLMKRADVSISEKYRQVLEAYQIELDYGTSFDTYEGRLGSGQNARTVNFVRLGRVTLLYQTLDGSETGYWDAQKKNWVVDNSYAAAAAQAMKVASTGSQPELLTLPVPAPQEISQ